MNRLFVFLGNPGSEYRGTRHNAGWAVCDRMCAGTTWQTRFHGQFAKTAEEIYLRPLTFMNLSGISVREAAAFFKVGIEDILVFHDDTELDFGEVLLQKGGGLRGHNGLRSIAKELGGPGFCRLRFGVGRPAGNRDLASFVLGRFSPDEETQLDYLIGQAVKLAREW